MEMNDSKYRANRKYNTKAYDTVSFVVPKGDREKIKAAAEAAGESLAEYMRSAVYARMERDAESRAVSEDTMDTVSGGAVLPEQTKSWFGSENKMSGSDWDTEDIQAKYIT